MKRFRFVLITLGLLSFLLLLTLLWLNFIYFPKKAKIVVVQGLEEQTGLQVELSDLSFHLLKGITLESLKLHDPKKAKTVLQVDRVYVQHLWIPLIFKKKFIASSITFQKPSFSLSRFEDGRWNFETFWKKKGEKSQITPFVPKVTILQGEFLFTDQSAPVPFSKHLTNVEAKIFARLPAHIAFQGSFGLQESPVTLTFQGNHSLKDKSWSFEGKAEHLSLSDLPPSFSQYLSFLKSEEGDVSLGETPLFFKGQLAHFEKPELDLTLDMQTDIQTLLKNLKQEKILHPVSMEGPMALAVRLKGKIDALSVSGALVAKDLLVKNIPSFGEIKYLRGKLTFTETSLETAALTGEYQGSPFALNGTLTDFQNPLLDIQLHFTFPLKQLTTLPAFEDIPEKSKLSLEGSGQCGLFVKGLLADLSKKNVSGSCQLQQASLRTPLLPEAVQKIDGELFLEGNTITARGITGNYSGNSFQLDGSLTQGQYPKVSFSLATEGSQLASDFTIQGKNLSPFSLTRRTSDALVSVEGEILNYENPVLNLRGRWEGPVEALAKWKGFEGNAFLDGALKGHLISTFILSGPKDRPDEIMVRGELKSPLITYKSWEFKNVLSRYTYHKKTFSLSQFSGSVFGGQIFGDASIYLDDRNLYHLKMEVVETKLRRVMHHFTTNPRGIRGLLSGAFEAEGSLQDAAGLAGEGWVKVEEGNLFQLPMLSGLSPILRPLVAGIYPQLNETIVFQEGYAHFDVKDKAITTKNAMIKGDRATLYGQGSIGFDQSLDFHIWIQFTDPAILGRPTDLSRLKNIFINDVGMLSGEVQLEGTLKNPKYRYKPLPFNRLQRLFQDTGNFLLERLFQ